MMTRKLLMISTDRTIFEEGSAVRARQAEYAKKWDEVHIVVFNKKKEKAGETVIAPNCWAYSTQSRSAFFYPRDAINLGRFIIEKRGITDITCQDASLTAMAGLSLKKRFGLPVEIQIHNDIGSPHFVFNMQNRIRKAMALSYIPKADHIRVVSEKIKGYLVGSLGIDAGKVEVRPIAVDVAAIKSAPVIDGADLRRKYPQFKKIVLVAARLEPEKNVGLAIKAFAQVVKEIPKAGLIIVGRGSEEPRLKALASGLGLDSSVIFESWASSDTVVSYYKTCDQFLVTSLFEGYGMALVEAQAAGCKIVSTDVGVAREVGATIIGWDPAEAAQGIIRMLKP